MVDPPYAGYPGLVFAASYQALNWLTTLLNSTSNISQIDNPVQATFQTLRNGIESISAWQTLNALSIEQASLIAIEALPISIDASTFNFMTARVRAVEALTSSLQTLLPPLTPPRVCIAADLLNQGEPVIADPLFLEWCMQFTGEVAPPGALLPGAAQDAADAWTNVATAIDILQGGPVSVQYDTAARHYRCAQTIANNIAQLQSGPFAAQTQSVAGTQLRDSTGNLLFDSAGNPIYEAVLTATPTAWNGVVALPTMLLVAAVLTSHPASIFNQQAAVIKFNLLTQLNTLAGLLLSLRIHDVIGPVTDTLRNTESLADLAARDLGDFESWRDIASLNRLQPPYPGPTNQALALAGKELFLTAQGVSPDPDASGISYIRNVLGVDVFWSLLNGQQLPWAGDFALITGYQNFSQALGRRIQTPLGSLIFHRSYGSRIPGEVGAVQTADEASRLLQYGNSAILADPRTASIQTATATTQPGFLATYSAVVNPVGPYSNSVQTNAVIGAKP
jgi:hypothetical protein